MDREHISQETRQAVWERWKGKCAFCSIDLPVEQHHIIALSNDASLADDPNNLILLCANHHALTQKKKPDGSDALSISDIEDLRNSGFAHLEKSGFYFKIPQSFVVNLGSNICVGCPYVLVVNKKPLIEIWPQQPTHYAGESRIYLYMRFFDEDDNFVGGMFANHWASVSGGDWDLILSENVIEVKNRLKPLRIRFEVKDIVVKITGTFYRDRIKIVAEEDRVVLPRNNVFVGNQVCNCEVAFSIQDASIGICGKL